jgi:hypothetical protein
MIARDRKWSLNDLEIAEKSRRGGIFIVGGSIRLGVAFDAFLHNE